ncbi:hypothetical protein FGO68_gene16181 [Halteria grandinella]|uniref:ATP-binding protein n=1 Tax=Halteria grandinella TaxID=5974 RepID=A0A8J8NH94_HALGN|nr:hypothetical protein FGO68_gene16181 [Halteria grandinella]
MESQKQIIVLLVGIPASGKTHLSQQLDDSFKNQVRLIEYDMIERELLDGQTGFDASIWQKARQIAYEKCRQAIDTDKTQLVILDDNFYYKSMRKPYYSLSRELSIGYLEIHLQVSVEEAVKRNLQRAINAVPQSVIENMAVNMEGSAYPEHAIQLSSENFQHDLLQLRDAIWYAQIPIRIEEAVRPLKIKQKQSIMHEFDQVLRKSLSSLLKEQPLLKVVAKGINDKRAQYFELIKFILDKKQADTIIEIQRVMLEEVQELIGRLGDDEESNQRIIERLAEVWKEMVLGQ